VKLSAATEGAPRSLVARAGLTYATNLVVAFLSLFNVLIVSRALGPEGRGDVAFLTTIAFLASNLGTFGVQESNSNIGGRDRSARRALATNSLALGIVFGGLCVAVIAGLAELSGRIVAHQSGPLLWLIYAAIPMLVFQLLLRSLVASAYGYGITNVAWLIAPVVNVVGNGCAFFVGRLDLRFAVATWVLGQAISTGLLMWWIVARGEGFGLPSIRLMRTSLGFGLKSHPGRIMLLGNYRLDQWILGALAGDTQLGLYSVAVAWSEALFYLPTSLSLVQRPDLVRVGRREAARQTVVVVRAAMILTAFLAVGMLVAAPFLCVTIFGPAFHGSIADLRVLTLGAFGILLMKQLGNALTAQQHPVVASAMTGVAFVTITALDFTLIPRFGGLGASFASTIAYSIGGVAVGAGFVRTLGGRSGDFVPRGADVTGLIAGTRRFLRGLLAEPVLAPPDSGA
jgi:O-antigen/teichoic acid export membrane protein